MNLKLTSELYKEAKGSTDAKGALIGFQLPIGPGEIKASYARYRLEPAGALLKPTSSKLAIGYVHNLSRRTALYATVARITNSNGASASALGRHHRAEPRLQRRRVRHAPRVLGRTGAQPPHTRSTRPCRAAARTLRWYGVVTLFVIVAISYVDRINIAVLITDTAFLGARGPRGRTTAWARASWPPPSCWATACRPSCSRRSARRCSACGAAWCTASSSGAW
jgi:hypothetical protein